MEMAEKMGGEKRYDPEPVGSLSDPSVRLEMEVRGLEMEVRGLPDAELAVLEALARVRCPSCGASVRSRWRSR